MSRSRWFKRALAGALTLSAAGGCKSQLFMDPADYKDATHLALPKTLETNPHSPITPGTVDRLGAQANTVIDFVRPARNMTLREAVALALEQGNVGLQNAINPGFKNEQLAQTAFGQQGLSFTDTVRAFSVDPALAAANIERSLSKFDARWINTAQWQKIDQPVAAQFLSFQQSRDAATLSSTLVKPLPTGGLVGITASTDYSKFSQSSTTQTSLVNPNYTPRVQFTVEQPLLRLFGVEANQLSAAAPNSIGLLPTSVTQSQSGSAEGILVTRLRLDQSRAQFDQQVNYLLLNVEAAYWNLYAAYYNLYAQEEGLRQSFEGLRFIKLRVQLGGSPPQDEDQARAQFYRFQGQVYTARGQVLESERQLRGLLGLRSDDGARVVPIDEPNVAPYRPDFHEAANDAIANRPELLLARQDVKFRQLDLLLQRNLRRPDLRGYAQYDVAGLGTRLDGRAEDFAANGNTTPGNAFSSLVDNRFNSWTLGMRLDMPIGFRDANALVRQSTLNMSRSYIQLRDSELKAIEYLTLQYRRLIEAHTRIAPIRAERQSLQQYLYRIRTVIDIGRFDQQSFLSYLTVQQQLATAIANESRAVADYNIALCQFEFAKGSIQSYNNVSVGDGQLPPWVGQRAADHIRERTEAAIKLREQPMPAGGPAAGGHPISQAGGVSSVLNLPPFAEKREPLPELNEPMPQPKNPGGINRVPALDARPLSGNPTSALPPSGNGTAAIDFQPESRVTLPPVPAGRPVGSTLPPTPPVTGTANGTGDYFGNDGRATIPQPPPLRTPPAVPTTVAPAVPVTPPTNAASGPNEFFGNEGRVTLPPAPKRTGDPVWTPGTTTPPTATTVPSTPAIPPTLPPLPGQQ